MRIERTGVLAAIALGLVACDGRVGGGAEPSRSPGASPDTGAATPGHDAGFVQAAMDAAQAMDMGVTGNGPADTGAAPPRDAGVRSPDAGFFADAGGDPGGGACPPRGPFGTRVGSVIPDVSLPDCDGNMHALHDLCGAKAAWIFGLAGW